MSNVHTGNGSGDRSFSFEQRLGLLTKKRQQLIRPIQEHPRDYVLLPIRDVARKLGTDPATVLRIVRGLGFGSYRDLRRTCTISRSPVRLLWKA